MHAGGSGVRLHDGPDLKLFILVGWDRSFCLLLSHVDDFNTRNKCLTAKLLKQGCRYHKLRKAFSKFYRRHYELISKFNVGLKSLLHQGLSEPEFYGDLVYKFKKIRGITDFSDQFRKIIMRYKRVGYDLNVMRQSACLVINPITVDGYAALFNCTPVDRASDSIWPRPKAIHFSWLGPELLSVAWSTGALRLSSFASDFQWCCLTDQGSPSVLQHIVSVESSSLLLHSYLT